MIEVWAVVRRTLRIAVESVGCLACSCWSRHCLCSCSHWLVWGCFYLSGKVSASFQSWSSWLAGTFFSLRNGSSFGSSSLRWSLGCCYRSPWSCSPSSSRKLAFWPLWRATSWCGRMCLMSASKSWKLRMTDSCWQSFCFHLLHVVFIQYVLPIPYLIEHFEPCLVHFLASQSWQVFLVAEVSDDCLATVD